MAKQAEFRLATRFHPKLCSEVGASRGRAALRTIIDGYTSVAYPAAKGILATTAHHASCGAVEPEEGPTLPPPPADGLIGRMAIAVKLSLTELARSYTRYYELNEGRPACQVEVCLSCALRWGLLIRNILGRARSTQYGNACRGRRCA